MNASLAVSLQSAVKSDDVAVATRLLEQHGGVAAMLATSEGCDAGQLLPHLRSVAMADLLFHHGLTPAMIDRWWTPGFGLGKFSSALAEHLVERGAKLSVHAAAALGLTDRLRVMLDREPALLHAKGGDGCRPLHFSRDVETARLLVERGAELDATDEDHDSTAAQWRIGEAPNVTRFLLERGARADIFIAAALNDFALAQKLVAEQPECTGFRIGNNRGPFPGVGFKKRGGTIYQWTLGFNQSPQEIAFHRGHHELFSFLMEHTPPRPQLLVLSMLADRSGAEALMAKHPKLLDELDEEDRSLLAKCCWETNLNYEVVQLMLDLGFPVDVPESNHGYLPLHNAAWCGDAPLVKLLLERGHPVDRRDPGYDATALGYALHSCLVAGRHPDGNFTEVARLLLAAGSPLDPHQYPTGRADLDAVIKHHGDRLGQRAALPPGRRSCRVRRPYALHGHCHPATRNRKESAEGIGHENGFILRMN